MNSTGETPTHPRKVKKRIKGPYSEEDTKLLLSHVYSGLKMLKDVGRGVNYEEFCQEVIHSLPEGMLVPEWISYWRDWQDKFRMFNISQRKKRDKIFEECMMDCKRRGFLPDETIGLTARFSQKIEKIIQEKTPSN